MLLAAAAQITIAAGHGEAIEPLAADQPLLLADVVVFVEQVPAHVVKDQLQRPHPQLASGAVSEAAHPRIALQPHAAMRHDRRLDRLGAARCGQGIAPHQGRIHHRMAGVAAHRRQGSGADAGPAQSFIQLGQQILGRGIRQPAGRLAHHVVHLPQTGRREHGSAEAVAVAHVVVPGAEAVGGEELLEILAEGGRFAAQVGTGDRFGGGDQVLVQADAALGRAVKRHLQQVAQQRHHPQEHRPIAQRRQPAMNRARGPRQRRQLQRRRAGDRAAEAVGLQPGQISADGAGIGVAGTVQPAENGCGAIGQVALRQRREDRLQLLGAGGIGGGQIRPGAQQPD